MTAKYIHTMYFSPCNSFGMDAEHSIPQNFE